jgi:hypothetical protein
MNFTVNRNKSSENSTISQLFIDGVFECYVLELPVTPECLPGRCAIPAGSYEIVFQYSPHFKRYNMRLLNVPGFEGVEIHTGNIPQDTEGCLLVGGNTAQDYIGNSTLTYTLLWTKVMGYINNARGLEQPIILTITDYHV